MGGRARCRVWYIIAATVLVCSLTSCLIYFSLQIKSKVDKQDEDIVEGNALKVKGGSIFLKEEKALDYQSDSAAATGNALTQPDNEVVDDVAEAAWGLLNAKLQCGSNKFKFKAMGPGAADLLLEMDNGRSLPIIQVPKECGFSVKQTALGLIVTISYDGCGVKQENGSYALLMKWREDDIKLTCTLMETPDETPATSESLTQPQRNSSSLGPQHFHRSKRQLRWPPMLYPCSPHRRSPLCMRTPPPAMTTTAQPTYPPVIHPYYMQKMLSLYPVFESYEQYLNKHPHKIMYQLAGKNPGWKLFQKPETPFHRVQNLLKMLPRITTTVPPTIEPTPCTTMSTMSYGGKNCLGYWRRWVPFPKFSPKLTFNKHPLQFMGENNYRTGSQTPYVSESLWESFPLIQYNSRFSA